MRVGERLGSWRFRELYVFACGSLFVTMRRESAGPWRLMRTVIPHTRPRYGDETIA